MNPNPHCYFELRKNSKQGNLNLAADMMRHLHTRQYLGKTVVLCERPAILLPNAHKQWLKLSRTIQHQRANTLNADKILKYTHTITHMQHMRFTTRSPLEAPEADVYFMASSSFDDLPTQCFNTYITATVRGQTATTLLAQLPEGALVVDYTPAAPWRELGALPKHILEERLGSEWQAAQAFLADYHVEPRQLFAGPMQNVEAMDDALDTLLGIAHQFLRVADSFNRALELARPLRLSKSVREQYDTFTLLAHRVQALSSAGFTQRFLETYNEDDTFFLYDSAALWRHGNLGFESLAEAITRHIAAGRRNLAAAIMQRAAQKQRLLQTI